MSGLSLVVATGDHLACVNPRRIGNVQPLPNALIDSSPFTQS
jgi:hypothetical protein